MIDQMAYKIIVLAASTGGKSTLLRYLRDNTDLEIAEMDEEIIKSNDNEWPADDDYKNQILVPKIITGILEKNSVVYLASYVPDNQLLQAKRLGFKIILVDLSIEELNRRNEARMKQEGYANATPWLQVQIDTFNRLKKDNIVDEVIDGNQTIEKLSDQIKKLATNSGT